jgi:hypothetical protein
VLDRKGAKEFSLKLYGVIEHFRDIFLDFDPHISFLWTPIKNYNFSEMRSISVFRFQRCEGIRAL